MYNEWLRHNNIESCHVIDKHEKMAIQLVEISHSIALDNNDSASVHLMNIQSVPVTLVAKMNNPVDMMFVAQGCSVTVENGMNMRETYCSYHPEVSHWQLFVIIHCSLDVSLKILFLPHA